MDWSWGGDNRMDAEKFRCYGMWFIRVLLGQTGSQQRAMAEPGQQIPYFFAGVSVDKMWSLCISVSGSVCKIMGAVMKSDNKL